MKQLVIDETNAKKLYPITPPWFKTVLEETFGQPFFSQKITDRVKTFEDACAVLGIDSSAMSEASDSPFIRAVKKLEIIVLALNEGWEPNWNNSSEMKWWPWFYMNDEPGFRLGGCFYDDSGTFVGARLVFKTEELARYAATHFADIYKDFMH